MDKISLTSAQEFEIEKMSRIIDSIDSIPDLKALSKQLLYGWMVQRAGTSWAIRQAMSGRGDRNG